LPIQAVESTIGQAGKSSPGQEGKFHDNLEGWQAMEEKATLSADQIKVTALVEKDGADYTCCNSDPYDSCYSYYDNDPTNGLW
jgi:hypothetical protein